MAKIMDWTNQRVRFISDPVKLMSMWMQIYSLVSWKFLIQTANLEDTVSVFEPANDSSLESRLQKSKKWAF